MGLFNDLCPVCGSEVSKRARFCSKCGHGAPMGWFKCPQCGNWVGNDSKHCPHCNNPLFPEDRIDLAGGVWARKPGEFARRFELDDVRFIKENGLMVQEGTVAVLLDGGKVVKVLGAGRHHPTGTLRAINWFGNPPPRSVVMVDAGDCVFRADFKGLRTAEELPVDVVAEITLRFDPRNADGFLENLFKDNRIGIIREKSEETLKVDGNAEVREASYECRIDEVRAIHAEAVGNWLEAEAKAAVKDLCAQSTVEDLVKDPERRPRFEDAIGRALKDLLKRSGLELVRVGYVDFISQAYEAVRKQYGELDAKRRQLEFDRKLHEFVLSDDSEKREFKLSRRLGFEDERYRELVITADSERQRLDLDERKKRESANRLQETEEYLAQLAQEKGLSSESRRAELEIAKETASGRIDAKKAEELLAKMARDHEVEFAELEHKLETARRLRADELDIAKHGAAVGDIDRSEKIKDAESDAAVARRRIDTSNYETKTAQELAQAAAKANLDNLERMAKIDAEERRSLAETVRGMSVEEMAAVLDDPGKRADMLELVKARLEAEKDKSASEADVAMAKASAEASQKDRLVDEMKAMMSDRAAHDEKLVAMLHDIAAKAVEKPVTVVNGAQPTPINVVK